MAAEDVGDGMPAESVVTRIPGASKAGPGGQTARAHLDADPPVRQDLLVRDRARADGDAGADLAARRGEIVALWQLPEAAVQPLGAAPRQQHRAVLLDPQRDPRDHRQLVEALPRGKHRQLVLAAGPARDARGGERAGEAARGARRAHRRAELHQSLVQLPRICARREPLHQLCREPPDLLRPHRRLHVGIDSEHPREHPRDVAVDQRGALAIRDRRDRPRGVRADAGHLAQAARGRRQRAAPPRHHLARPAVQIAGARVVAEPRPVREHVIERRLGERPHRRKPPQPPLPVRDHRRDPRLLQHDLGHPDRVRVPRPPPRQVPPRPRIVRDHRRRDLAGLRRHCSTVPCTAERSLYLGAWHRGTSENADGRPRPPVEPGYR